MGPVRKNSQRGFTLIELLAVMSIMGIMMFLAVGSFGQWFGGTGMRTSIMNTSSGITQARQWAVSHRTPTRFKYGNDEYSAAYYVVVDDNDGSIIGNTNYLAKGIIFDIEDEVGESFVRFKTDGSSDWEIDGEYIFGENMTKDIVFKETKGDSGMMATTSVYRLTGHIRTGRR